MIISIKDNKFNCKVVATPKKIREGMMFKKFDGFDGMFFIMPQEGPQSFWMKNCIIPLDIIFITKDIITDMSRNCPPCVSEQCPSYEGEGGFVLELPGGTCKDLGIRIGDRVDYL